MEISVIGTGFVGGILGRALSSAGHQVTFGSRKEGDEVAANTTARVTSVGEAIASSGVVILAVPGSAVTDLATEYANALAGKLVVDATNQMGAPVTNARAALPLTVRYARAFNTLGGENLAKPAFADGPADMFFSAPRDDRATTEEIIEGVGLHPVYVGEDKEALLDALFQLWIELAVRQGRGRRLALRLIDG